MARAAALALGLATACGALGATACGTLRPSAHVPDDDGRADALRVRWSLVTSDRTSEVAPQEFGGVATVGENLFTGSAGGRFMSLRALDGRVRWTKRLGAVDAPPLVAGDRVFVGTNDGELLAVGVDSGEVLWRYASRGAIGRAPVLVNLTPAAPTPDYVVVFSNEADQVVALDAASGAFRWQYKAETPEEFTLRGHAGVVVAGDLLFTGFANGTLVALRASTGTAAWLTTLTGDSDRFVDVDATPVVDGDTVYVTSSSGGVWALDQATGLVRWRTQLGRGAAGRDASSGAVGGLAVDAQRIYVAAADLGVFALDHDGNELWRHGTAGAGEPATPQLAGDYVIYALTDGGLYVADKRSGSVLQFFDPGDGVSADPVVVDNRDLYVMSNRGVLYAFDLNTL